METKQQVQAYIQKNTKFSSALSKIRAVFQKLELEETVKWGMPTYTVNGKNVVGIGAFKNHFGVWFFQGALLKDKANKLRNAQEGKTAAMRQWRFESADEIDEKLLTSYAKEAIQNQLDGKEIKPNKPIKKAPKAMPALMESHLAESKKLQMAFQSLTPGKQKEYIEYIYEAKRETTKLSRLSKISKMILVGEGLNDRYK